MAKGLPKSIVKKYGVTKQAWKVYRSRKNKRKVNKSPRKSKSRRKSMGKKKRRRRSRQKIPLEVAVGLVSIPFTPAQSGFASIIECAQRQDWTGIADNLKSGFLGMDGRRGTPEFNLMGAFNPFDMNHARYTKMLIYAGLMSKVRKKLVRIPLNKVPLIGKYIS